MAVALTAFLFSADAAQRTHAEMAGFVQSPPTPLPALRPEKNVDANDPAPLPAFEPEVTRQICLVSSGGRAAKFSPLPPIAGKNGCGASHPVKLIAVGIPQAHILPPATVSCALTGALSAWTEELVQEAAMTFFGEKIVAYRNASSYVCRTRNNQPGARMSEHAAANALDISAFRTASGRWVDVAGNWDVASPESQFLKAVHRGACDFFSTVLGPDANAAHHDHFHLDMGTHGRTGTYRVCE